MLSLGIRSHLTLLINWAAFELATEGIGISAVRAPPACPSWTFNLIILTICRVCDLCQLTVISVLFHNIISEDSMTCIFIVLNETHSCKCMYISYCNFISFFNNSNSSYVTPQICCINVLLGNIFKVSTYIPKLKTKKKIGGQCASWWAMALWSWPFCT